MLRRIPRSPRSGPALRAIGLVLGVLALGGCGGGAGAGSPAASPAPAPAPAAGSPVAPAPAPATPPSTTTPTSPVFDGRRVTAGAGCTLEYTLTQSPLIAGPDPLRWRQWHLENTGQWGGRAGEDVRAVAAWTLTRGAGVRIAVIDDSVEITHPDLQPNLAIGASRSYRPGNVGGAWPLPCTFDDGHGTAVAGIALARDQNGIGVAGVAPLASLAAFDALSSGLDVDVADALVREGGANHVYHNSWGSPDDGALHPPEASFREALETGIATGRQGLGSVYVFSAGNGGCFGFDVAGRCLDDDANYDGYVNHRAVIAVCATDDSGRRAAYSEPGANLTVCAPSGGGRAEVTTTGLQGTWRNDFNGTSAAAPMVSGVVALMLSVNPALTWRDVRLILAATARQNDPGDAGWSRNYGYAFNHQYGFGVVDADAAVRRARIWSSVGGSESLKTCTLPVRAPNAVLRNPLAGGLQPATDTVVVSDCPITQIEWVELRLTASHPRAGDLRVTLTSPNGLVSRLADYRSCDRGCGSYADWRFGSMRHLGEPSSGPWTLEVVDAWNEGPSLEGRLQQWNLVLHGR